MDNVTFIEVEVMGVTETHALIDHGNEQFTSMPKAVYEAQQAAQVEHLTEISTGAN